VDTALVTSCIVLLAIPVVACVWVSVRGRRRRREDNEPKLTNAAKHFATDKDLIGRQTTPIGPRVTVPVNASIDNYATTSPGSS
jgi:hypothetical protein